MCSPLDAERIVGVESSGCPHTAIREDASINLVAIDRILEKIPSAIVVFVESGGDNLAYTHPVTRLHGVTSGLDSTRRTRPNAPSDHARRP